MQARIEAIHGDITRIHADAIVNAANSRLAGGGGVDGAIHRAGGPEIMEECDRIRQEQGGCPTGEAVVTTAGKLPAKKVIHTVGPIWQGGKSGEEKLLANAYRNSLSRAAELGFQSVAFPNISTGVYGYPKKEAAHVAVKTVKEFLDINPGIKKVTFVCFDEESFKIYSGLIKG
ncbi:MAG TPA: O-acetyl-ADP-ribose deacetylase [Cyclobacteriaceae bacterium]|nr:O-acetyl-ADP-ribose deacetylase [Cyclobacteriaceae bacterium]